MVIRKSDHKVEKLFTPASRVLTLQWLAAERDFAYTSCDANRCSVYVVTGTPYQSKKVMDADCPPTYVETGHWAFIEGSTIYVVSAGGGGYEPTGRRVVLAEKVLNSTRYRFDIQGNGVMVYPNLQSNAYSKLLLVDRQGRTIREISGEGLHYTPKFSDNGKTVAYAEGLYGVSRDIWVLDLERGIKRRITDHPGDDGVPVWSLDGQTIAFSSGRSGKREIWSIAASGLEQPRMVVNLAGNGATPGSFSPDKRTLFVHDGLGSYAADLETGTLTALRANMSAPRISTDGKWMAYEFGPDQRRAVYLSRYPLTDEAWQVSDEGGSSPIWRHDMKELFFVKGADVYAVEIRWIDGKPQPQVPMKLFTRDLVQAEYRNGMDVSPDGKQFVVIKPASQLRARPKISVLLNWQRLLEEGAK